MKERSDRAKNITGGFLGAVFGLLVFDYLYEPLLPLGCLLGAIIGVYYEKILQSGIDGWHVGKKRAGSIRREIFDSSAAIKSAVLTTDYLKPFKLLFEFCKKTIDCICFFPKAFCKWFTSRPMLEIHLTNAFAAIASIIISLYWFMPLCYEVYVRTAHLPVHSDARFLFGMIPLFIGAIILMSSMNPFLEEDGSREDFYKAWDAYERNGMLRYFLKSAIFNIVFQILSILLIVGVVSWYVLIGGLFLIGILAPMGFVIGILKGIYAVSKRTDHWLCFAVSLCVTLISVYFISPYFDSKKIVWITALVAGAVSGLISDVVRTVVFKAYEKYPALNAVGTRSMGSLTKPARKSFSKTASYVTSLFIEPIREKIHK